MVNSDYFKKKLQYFEKGEGGSIEFKKKNIWPSTISLYLFVFFISGFFAIIFLRLFQLTISKGDYYRRLSEENRVREVVIEAKRGKILDRKGFVIVENKEIDLAATGERLFSQRRYLAAEAVAHLVGFRGLADPIDLKNDNCFTKLKAQDRIGKKGVEKIYDCDLRGKAGKKLIEVDARSRYLKTLTVIPAGEGKTIQLAVDLELQKKAYDLIKDKKGAVVVLKPKTGEILVFVSSPSFNPQDFEDGKETKIKKYLSDQEKPLLNRASEAVYPPGSLFKSIVAVAGLEEKKIEEKTLFEDTGTIAAGPLTFGNWYFLQYGKTEGMVDVIKAIRRSNDIFFYKTGGLLGPEKIKLWAERFGLGKKTGLGLDEAEGLVPSSFWKEEVLKDRWYLGDTYNLSIGQGYVLVTPLQMAVATAVFANDGYLCQPQLLKAESQKPIAKNCKKLPISQKTLDLVKEGMRQACSPGGTGWPLFNFKFQISDRKPQEIQTACKTGTAESHAVSKIPHAWFTVYAPVSSETTPIAKPEIVVTVLIEEGGQGSDVAAPIARDILKTYFERTQ